MAGNKDPKETKKENEDLKALVVALANTSESLEHGEKIYENLGRTVRRMRVTLWVAFIGLALDLALSMSFAFILNNQSDLNEKIQENSDRITKVTCDLNTIFLQADTVERYDNADNKKLYVQWYHAIYENRKELNCQPAMNEPVSRP